MSISSIRIITIITAILVFIGCAHNPQLQIQRVYIPVGCLDNLPPKPRLDGPSEEVIQNIMRAYIELRALLAGCIRKDKHEEN